MPSPSAKTAARNRRGPALPPELRKLHRALRELPLDEAVMRVATVAAGLERPEARLAALRLRLRLIADAAEPARPKRKKPKPNPLPPPPPAPAAAAPAAPP
ncbi:MAG: hypothetical protein N4A39_15880, partial [Roseicyclus sp.]|nr:hypothetical protein [Roseicyclus sp.]